jgi:hypothetical protein
MASVLNLAGALSGTAVASTIGTGILDPALVDLVTVGAAMCGIILWSMLDIHFVNDSIRNILFATSTRPAYKSRKKTPRGRLLQSRDR